MDSKDNIEVNEEICTFIKTEPSIQDDQNLLFDEDQFANSHNVKPDPDGSLETAGRKTELLEPLTAIKREIATHSEEEKRMFVAVGLEDTFVKPSVSDGGIDIKPVHAPSQFYENQSLIRSQELIHGMNVNSNENNTGRQYGQNLRCISVEIDHDGMQFQQLNDNSNMEKPAKAFKCDLCNKNFTRRGSLRAHLLIHTGEKPFNCTNCNKNFNSKSVLMQHLNIHSSEKPFKCDQCNDTFNWRSSLDRHSYIHSSEKNFKCNHCEREFKRKPDLRNHLRTHSDDKPYNCPLCDKCFKRRKDVTTHLRSHSDDKPHKCDQCSVGFKQRSHLNTHLIMHSGEKLHRCLQCNKDFTRKTGLKNHLLTHTNND